MKTFRVILGITIAVWIDMIAGITVENNNIQSTQIIDPYTCTKIIHSKVMYVYLFNNNGQEIQHFRGRLIQRCGYKYTGSGFTDTFLLTSGIEFADEGYEYVEADWPLHFRTSK